MSFFIPEFIKIVYLFESGGKTPSPLSGEGILTSVGGIFFSLLLSKYMLSLHPLKGGGRILRGKFSLQGGFHFRGILTSGGVLILQMRQFLSRKVKFEKEKTKYFKKGGTNKFFTSPKEPNNKINPRNQINPPLQGGRCPLN